MKNCPICNSNSGCMIGFIKGSRTGKKSPILACLRCRSLWQRPEYREDGEALRADLQYHLNCKLNPNHLAKDKNVVQQLRESNPDGKHLLDIGCGIGSFMTVATDAGLVCRGVEPNPHAATYGREHHSLDIEDGFFEARSFREKFDFVVADNVLEHVPNPGLFISEVFKVLAPDGIFMLAVPDMRGGILRVMYSFLFRNKYSLFADNDVHINHFSTSGAILLVSEFGGVLHSQFGPGSFLFRRNIA